ncbi:MAG: transglutaminase-like domain-containing protein [Alphaproteobacteria bacterium]|nr:transglutaminase-like domain-containing protein [Alphaproteobacteria bacterium]
MAAALEPIFVRLREIGSGTDAEIDLGKTALLLSELAHPGIVSERYLAHIRKLGEDVGHRYHSLLTAGAEDSADTRLAALKHTLADQYGYHGDEVQYDDIRNADLIDVIERRMGMPITLSILYILAAQAQGWDVAGLNVPGHFVVRLEKDGQRLIFDPFHCCAVLNAPDLRQLIKKTMGEHAELSASYFEPVGPRQILIRLQNNIKIRLIEGEDYERALQVVESMRALDPHEYRLLLDAGVLCARTGRAQAAMVALEDYIKQAPDQRDRQEAAILLQHIRSTLQ